MLSRSPSKDRSTSSSASDPGERLTELLAECHDDPDLFNTAILGRPPFWSKQREIGDSLVKYQVTVCYTGNAIGKDYALGTIIPWWPLTRKNSLVVVTGPSQTLLGSVTWKEVRSAVNNSKVPLGLKISQGIRCSPLRLTVKDDWGALGFSTTSVERASGQHNPKLLVIVEEASGVEDEIWDAIESLKYDRLLIIGNPIRATGGFIRWIRQAEKDQQEGIPPERAANAIRIPSTASPDADKEKSDWGLADKTWLENNYRRYGRDSLWVRSHILAEIPTVSSDQLIPGPWLDRAAASIHPPLYPFDVLNATRRISCDLGEGVGRDSTSIIVRDDVGVLECIAGNALGLSEAAGEIARLARKWHVAHNRISYDRLGIGRDLRNHLIRNGITEAIGYAGSGRARDPRQFTNIRTEAAWKLRQRLNPDWSTDPRFPEATRQGPFCIPPGEHWPAMREELEKLTYDLVGNQTRLITKEDFCELLGRSPDRSDALIQSFAF
jgi:hypothetical protein